MDQYLFIVVDGVIYSSWLFIIAVGLTLIYGVMKILNVAHGSLYALGAYAATSLGGYWLGQGYPPMGSYGMLVAAAILVGLIAGPVIERLLLRRMYGKEEVVLVLITYAVFLILEDLTKLVWGVDPLSIAEPYSLLGNMQFGGLIYPDLQSGRRARFHRGRGRARSGAQPHPPRQDPASRDSRPRDECGDGHQRLPRLPGHLHGRRDAGGAGRCARPHP